MKCPNCGAEIDDYARECEYCGTAITSQALREKELVRKKGCPNCGSTNTTFRRENHGEIRGKNSKQNVYRTIGFCQDCGHTFLPSGQPTNVGTKNSNMIWWILGWIFFFPAPAMVLIWRKKNTWDIKVKIGVTVAFWVIFFILGSTGNKGSSSSTSKTVETSEPAVETVEEVKEEIEATPVVEDVKEDIEPIVEQVKEVVEEAKSEYDNMTTSQKMAVKSAQNYLSFTSFSRDGLIQQLSSDVGEGFTVEDATFAVDYLESNSLVDWNEQAVKAGQNYLSFSAFSKDGLIQQLSSDAGDKYSQEQAEYAVGYMEDNSLVDWNEQAVKAGQNYLSFTSFSRDGLIQQLSSDAGDKYTKEQAEYAANQLGF